MNKILLIIQREYITRVKKKSFIIMSLLGPLLIGGVMAFVTYLAMNQGENISRIKVVDETGVLAAKIQSSSTILLETEVLPIDSARKHFDASEFYGILYLPKNTVLGIDKPVLYTQKQPKLSVVEYVETKLRNEIESIKLAQAGINKATLDSIKTKIDLQQKPVDINGKDKSFSAGITSAIGFIGGLLIYLFIFVYGVQVMRGVLEEKTNRIVEVIISSVKPFQLMMGKIIGIALTGLTQIIIWIVLSALVTTTITSVMVGNNKQTIEQLQKQNIAKMNGIDQRQMDELEGEFNLGEILSTFNFTKIIVCFIFYFIGGYLLYSALFAAIGAAVDSETDTQQFMLPVTIPLIIAYVVGSLIMANPESKLGYWFSLIPFTSPVVMMVRLPFDPPWIDIIISMILLVAGFIFTTWLAAKIYRTGILMYGKKVTWKEMGKWLFYNG